MHIALYSELGQIQCCARSGSEKSCVRMAEEKLTEIMARLPTGNGKAGRSSRRKVSSSIRILEVGGPIGRPNSARPKFGLRPQSQTPAINDAFWLGVSALRYLSQAVVWPVIADLLATFAAFEF